MGHQFYKRLAGKWMTSFQYELECDTPDIQRLADYGCKVVHFSVEKILAAGDLARLLAAIRTTVIQKDLEAWGNRVPIEVSSAVFAQLRAQPCIYLSEAENVAQHALQDICRTGMCDMSTLKEAATRFFADQISLSETVYRIPRDGLFGAQETAKTLTAEMVSRVNKNRTQQQDHATAGTQRTKKRLRAPRARAKRQSSQEIGDGFEIPT